MELIVWNLQKEMFIEKGTERELKREIYRTNLQKTFT